MAQQHSPRFLQIVQDAKSRIRELTVDQVKAKLNRGEKFHLIDVREESEWAKDHVAGAEYLGKGVIERDVEGVAGIALAEGLRLVDPVDVDGDRAIEPRLGAGARGVGQLHDRVRRQDLEQRARRAGGDARLVLVERAGGR